MYDYNTNVRINERCNEQQKQMMNEILSDGCMNPKDADWGRRLRLLELKIPFHEGKVNRNAICEACLCGRPNSLFNRAAHGYERIWRHIEVYHHSSTAVWQGCARSERLSLFNGLLFAFALLYFRGFVNYSEIPKLLLKYQQIIK